MYQNFKRRNFLKTLIASPLLATAPLTRAEAFYKASSTSRLKLSLNAYSFNEPLRNGSMSLFDLLDFCAGQNFDAVDLTGYYFPGYPKVPAEEFIFKLKKQAFKLGLDISGTGVRNDFSNPDPAKRKEDVALIKQWIEVASKLGAPVIRIFSGLAVPAGYTWDAVAKWMVEDLKECAAHGKTHGVIVAIQNHFDFIKTADEATRLIEGVGSEWFGLVLDIGSYRGPDPFNDIAATAKYAVNWQLKENMYVNGVEQKTDVRKIISLIKASGYRGYVPIETLGAGDPTIKVPVFLKEVRREL